VHHNVVAIQVDREPAVALGTVMTWYAADGQVIKRVGSLSEAKRG
jgi:hypothetical protein